MLDPVEVHRVADLLECLVISEKHVSCGRSESIPLGVNSIHLMWACAYLRDEKGYTIRHVKKNDIVYKILSAPGTTQQTVWTDWNNITE